MNKKFKLTSLERSWVLYDVGNSAFVLMYTTLIPQFFNGLASAGGLDSELYLSYWGYTASIVTMLVAIIGPICGTLADRNFKKPIFTLCVAIGALACSLMGLAPGWLSFLIIYVIAKVGCSSSLVFYDSMLPEITSEERMDKISSMGFAYGYIGSVIPFVVCLVLVLMCDSFGMSIGTAMSVSFVITAIWWVACTLPLLKRYKQNAVVSDKGAPLKETFLQLGRTLRDAKKDKHIFLYLVAFFFFIDGVYTIIDMATAYGTSLGLNTNDLLIALLWTQIVAFPCAIIFGRLSAKYDTGKLIKVCIIAYTGIVCFAVFLMTEWQFWVLATLVGMFQGGIQALSRSYMGKIIEPERSGEFFGLMDICGKGASFVGMALVSFINQMTAGMTVNIFGLELQNENIAVSALIILFAIGYFTFCKADRLNKDLIKAKG